MDEDVLANELLHDTSAKVLTVVCFSVAILFLCAHLIVFVITEYERTIMGKNFAAFCFATLLGYVSYIGGIVLRDSSPACGVAALVGHFLAVAQSAWLLATSVETWKSIRTAKTQQEYESRHTWRFAYYSLFGWLTPAAVTALALCVEYVETGWPDSLRPSVSPKSCRFGRSAAFLVLHALPVNACLVANFAFIAATVVKLRHAGGDVGHVHADMVREFKYYLRLNVFVGLTWICGLVGEYVHSETLIVVYVLMNALQGLYIFLIMTFHDKISTFIYYVDTDYGLTLLSNHEDEDDDFDFINPYHQQSSRTTKITRI